MAVKTGDKVPEFSLKNDADKQISISDFIGKGPLVIYFYPKDDTPGCTMEACSFRDHFEVFQEYGAEIFGISADSPSSHEKFKKRYRLPFTLLSDESKKVQRSFGVKKNLFGLLDGRVTYIIDKAGVVRYIFSSQIQPKKHIDEAIRVLKRISKE